MKLLRFFFLVAGAAVVFVGPQLRNYVAGRDAVPPGVTLAGANIGGATADEAAANVRKVFEAPVSSIMATSAWCCVRNRLVSWSMPKAW